MSISSTASKVASNTWATLRKPFRRNGQRTRLHPASLFGQAGQVAGAFFGPIWAKVWGWVKKYLGPVFAPISPLGWMVLLTVIALWIVGGIFGWLETQAVALLGSLLLLIAIGFILGRSSYGIVLDLARTRVAVGDQAVGSVAVSNTSNRALLPASLELPVGGNTAVFHLPRMKPQEVHEDLFTIPTVRRAVIVVGPVRSVRADPLRLLRRQVLWTEPTDLYVHPRTTALIGSAAGFLKDLEGLPTTELSSADVSFHALRDYIPGDDRRHIHWKTTARTGKLMVRQFEETRRAHIAIALSINTAEYENEEAFELAISAAASIGRQAIREQRELSVHDQRGPLHCATGRTLMDDMTRIQGSSRLKDSVELAREMADAVPNASVVFFVVGSLVTPRQLRAAAASVPPGVRTFAIRCAPGAKAARNNIADLTVMTLGELSELPLILRKAAA
ncbi:DUF58 domain-containing protein [Psychromicrobium lacuslunae]|uniref:DUF58 domain-containing protein n=1 Tax=Psychromicrobium lacuslunae TaxID=1618207 RepID=A0A0D4BVW6_9MICC|nr:DUF58 domain-containing protein [Psychromicrobium lacuslunae]AJT40469.1 hypothetical protein UM93_00925 [Psychromicrobium lacuslunae]